MFKRKFNKGEYEYPGYEKKRVIIRTIAYFAISAAVFLLGWISTGTRNNLLTIVAVLGLLPSSKSLVAVIMYMRIPEFSREVYEEITSHAGTVDIIYSMYLTSYKLNFAINCLAAYGGKAASGGVLIGFTQFEACDAAACEKHIKDMLNQNSIKGVTVKVFKEKQKFIDRLLQINSYEKSGKEGEILELMCDVSL